MINFNIKLLILAASLASFVTSNGKNDVSANKGIPLFYWQLREWFDFGDYLSFLKLGERIVGRPIKTKIGAKQKKLLAVGSIFAKASDGDIIWGSGVSGKRLNKSDYTFTSLDIRAVRGPLTRQFIMKNFNIDCPEVYGDPVLLLPIFFLNLKRKNRHCMIILLFLIIQSRSYFLKRSTKMLFIQQIHGMR